MGIVDMRSMPAGVYQELLELLPRAKFVPAGDITLECRRVKSVEEQNFMYKTAECTDNAFKAIFEIGQPGVTAQELTLAAEAAMEKSGARRGNFITLDVKPWEDHIKI